jgi:protein-disulfide isomerase-like protein with CxxC motif
MKPDVDTSMNRDPSPTGDELLAIRDRMLARLESGAPVRVIRSANLLTSSWRSDVRFLAVQRGHSHRSHEVFVSQVLADTGEHLGLDRVGLVVGSDEVTG